MKKRYLMIFMMLVISSLLFSAYSFPELSAATSGSAADDNDPQSPVKITGEFAYSNEFVVETYYVEHAVALLDMTGFVKRDKEWELPVNGQVLGYMKLDAENNRATFELSLPAQPQGIYNDVDQDNQTEQGVQIFTVGYSPNLTGDVFSDGDDRSLGWPSYLASVKTDSENEDEVTGGRVVIWADESGQQFPSSFGEDGLLFTADDPQMNVPAGFSVIDLDSNPFTIIREREVALPLYEPTDIAVKDFSNQSYSKAFESMFAIASKEYAFNGVDGKQPDWNALHDAVAPKIAQAEKDGDAYSYYLALRDFRHGIPRWDVGSRRRSGSRLQSKTQSWRVWFCRARTGRRHGRGGLCCPRACRTGWHAARRADHQNQWRDVQTAIDKRALIFPQSTDFGARHEKTVFPHARRD
jgi:hypothetical protein